MEGGAVDASSLTVGPGAIGSLTINGGSVTSSPSLVVLAGGSVTMSPTGRIVAGISTLDVDDTSGRIDLGAGQLSIAAGGVTAEQLRADIIAGRNGGAWDGAAGITSATAATTPGTRAVGYTVAGDGSAKVSFAAPGDTNLDGLVNFSDIQAIITGGRYGQAVTTGVWSVGDFNYDGRVNFTDIQGLITAGRYGQASYFPAAPVGGLSLGGGGGLGTGGIAAVPEPGMLGTLGAVAIAGLAATARLRRSGTAK
jgi:hypothetical protein